MFKEVDSTGTLINSFAVCRRKAWLNSRKIGANRSNSFILMGSSYNRSRDTQRRVGNIEIDEIEKGKHIIVKEYKKTFSNIEASKMQLLFYMKNLKKSLS